MSGKLSVADMLEDDELFGDGVGATPPAPSITPKVEKSEPTTKDIKIPKHQDTNKDTKVSRYQQINNTADTSLYKEKIRMLLMSSGDNASSLRVNDEEKILRRSVMRSLEDENLDADNTEIMRLAIDYMFLEYMDNGNDSILAQIIRYIRDPINNA